jgi:serine/threonine protein kinase
MKYPRKLSTGENNTVIVLNESEVGKLFSSDTRSDIGSEATKLQFANSVNNLFVQFKRIEYHEELKSEMIVMERIYPLDYRSYEVEIRIMWLDIFEDELNELHRAGFVHRDLIRPSVFSGLAYDNILLTKDGLRLIDVGMSTLRTQVGDEIFGKFVEMELQEMSEFRVYFLNR